MALSVPGAHNARNAAAALTAAPPRGRGPRRPPPRRSATSAAPGAASSASATHRAGALVVDDYAHHPTEVRATIEAARTLRPRRVVAAFQPHLYSRTRHTAREFGAALALADLVVVLDVYPARERAEDFPGVTGLLVAEAAADHAGGRPVAWLPGLRRGRALPARDPARGRRPAHARGRQRRRAGPPPAGLSGRSPGPGVERRGGEPSADPGQRPRAAAARPDPARRVAPDPRPRRARRPRWPARGCGCATRRSSRCGTCRSPARPPARRRASARRSRPPRAT